MRKIILLTVAILTIFSSFAVHAQTVQMDGRASYYHNSLHGRRMANGQRYNRDSMTCAHRTLPFGTRLRVTNPINGRQVIVTVTDRGPYVRGRVIDLSYAAANRLGTIRSGVAMVRIEILPKENPVPYADDNIKELPEVEYGGAGVCYEFIPEWEKVKEQPKKLPRKVNTAQKKRSGNNRKAAQAKPKQQNTAKAQPKRQKKSASSWQNLFDKVKNGVTSLFD